MLSRFLPVSSDSAMNFAMNFLKRLVFMRPVCECSANVIRFPDLNIIRTRVKQIRNPRKEIFWGFFYLIFDYIFNNNQNA
jgi:hypothetical protein